jgi:hypothetical protein
MSMEKKERKKIWRSKEREKYEKERMKENE